MPQWVYIIQSESNGKYYCGQSSNVEQRLMQHNDPDYTLSKTTKRNPGPWRLIWTCGCADLPEATQLERKIKKRGIARYLKEAGSAESRHGRD
jgi:putative endonuclease